MIYFAIVDNGVQESLLESTVKHMKNIDQINSCHSPNYPMNMKQTKFSYIFTENIEFNHNI